MSRKRKKTGVSYIIFIGTAVVLFWRGAWGLMDLLIFPNNELLSYVVSIILGLFILYLNHEVKDELL